MNLFNFSTLVLLILSKYSVETNDFNINGTTAGGWEFVRDLFRENFEKGHDLGASIAVYYKGELVVDLAGGWFDQSKTKIYDKNTLQLVFSTTKGLVATAAALCVQRGLFNYSDLVSKYWPEYNQNGKENTTIADILSHRAGLPHDSSSFETYWNWTEMIRILEKKEPLWTPGSKHGYHSLTYGWLAGEIVKRVDRNNRTIGQFIQDEISKKLDIEFYIGLPSNEEHRVSPLVSRNNQSQTNSILHSFNDQRTIRAEIPAVNGISNARSIAKLYAALLGNIENNKYQRLLNEETFQKAIKSNTPDNELDFVFNFTNKFGMGFMLIGDNLSLLGKGVFGHLGFGGSVGIAAPEKHLSFAYSMNNIDEIQFDIDQRYKQILYQIATKIHNRSNRSQGNSVFVHFLLLFLIFSIKSN